MVLSAISFPGLGITVDPSPVAFTVFGKDIYWYGIIIAFGFLMAYFYMNARCKSFGLSQDNLLDMLFWLCRWVLSVPGSITVFSIGISIGTILYPASTFGRGGLAIYGGVIGGALGLFLCHKIQKRPFFAMLDLASFGVLIGQIFGRWGNFMNREAHGGETDSLLRMGLVDPDGVTRYYHPTFLYESVWNLVGLVILHIVSKKRKFDGEVVLLYLFWYGLGRAWIEGLRTDSLYLFGTGIRVSQLVALLCVLGAGAALIYILLVKKPDPSGMYVNKVRQEKKTGEETAENLQ